MAGYGGPRLSRFYNYENVEYLPAPTGGWNPDASPYELPLNQAAVLDNFLIRPNRIVMRGRFLRAASIRAGAQPLCASGCVIGDTDSGTLLTSWMLMGRKTHSATANVDPWNAPLVRPTAAQLATGVTTAEYVGAINGPPSLGFALTRNQVPGPRWINFDGLLYGLAYDSTGAVVGDTNSNYVVRPTALLTLPLTQAGFVAPTVLANAPHAAADLKGYLSRIWLLSGIDTPGGGATFNATTLFFSEGITAGGGAAAADWRNPVTGLTNQIVVDRNTHDFGVGLAVCPRGLLVFRRSSVWLLLGKTPASFTLQQISKQVGCMDARSIVETDQGVYWISANGLMFTNGVTIRNVSGPAMHTLRSAIVHQQIQMVGSGTAGVGGYISCGLAVDGSILVSLGNESAGSGGLFTPVWSGLYDPATGAWTRITSQLFGLDMSSNPNLYPGLLVGRPGDGQLVSIGDTSATRVDDLRSGHTFTTIDTEQQGLYDWDANVSFYSIPAVWTTRAVDVVDAGRRKLGQAKRFFVDSVFAGQGVVPANGWAVTPVDASGGSFGPTLNIPKGAATTTGGSVVGVTPVAAPSIVRTNQDFTNEIADLSFTASWVDPTTRTATPANVLAELYGIGVEFQRTSDRR